MSRRDFWPLWILTRQQHYLFNTLESSEAIKKLWDSLFASAEEANEQRHQDETKNWMIFPLPHGQPSQQHIHAWSGKDTEHSYCPPSALSNAGKPIAGTPLILLGWSLGDCHLRLSTPMWGTFPRHLHLMNIERTSNSMSSIDQHPKKRNWSEMRLKGLNILQKETTSRKNTVVAKKMRCSLGPPALNWCWRSMVFWLSRRQNLKMLQEFKRCLS